MARSLPGAAVARNSAHRRRRGPPPAHEGWCDGRTHRTAPHRTAPHRTAPGTFRTGTFRYACTYPLALELIASGAVEVKRLATHRFSLEETEVALTVGRREPESIETMVLPQG